MLFIKIISFPYFSLDIILRNPYYTSEMEKEQNKNQNRREAKENTMSKSLVEELIVVNETKPNFNQCISWLTPLLHAGYIQKDKSTSHLTAVLTAKGREIIENQKFVVSATKGDNQEIIASSPKEALELYWEYYYDDREALGLSWEEYQTTKGEISIHRVIE